MHPDTIETCSLASGSKGNAYCFRTAEHAFLIDAGISCRRIRQGLAALGTELDQLSGIFITHEHGDHIRGLETISRNHRIPLYINKATLNKLRHTWEKSLLKEIKTGKPVKFGSTTIHIRAKSHDVAEPVFFIVSHAGKNIPVITDLGTACRNAEKAVQHADAVYLETNYDPQMLRDGEYPEYVKARIDSVRGHLSNGQAADLIRQHASTRLQYIFLSHISENNNTPSLARRAVREAVESRDDLAAVRILTATQNQISEIVRL